MSWVVDQKELHITVGSVPRVQPEKGPIADLKNDVEMVKVGLLYADHTKLASFSSSALFSLLNLTEIPHDRRLEFLKELSSSPAIDQNQREGFATMVEAYEQAWRRRYSKRGRVLLREMDEGIAQNWGRARKRIDEYTLEIGGEGLIQAVSSGLLEVHRLKSVEMAYEQVRARLDTDVVHKEYIDVVSAAVSDGRTYPLFDEITSNLISSRIADGIIPVSSSGVDRGKEVALAADLFARLPLFPHASINEILDIRHELEIPLRRFRSAMIAFSEKIADASWDRHFSADADQVFRRDVAPAIIDLEEAEESNPYLRAFLSKLADKAVQIGGAVGASASISTVAVKMLNVPLTDVAALAVLPVAAIGGIAYNAYIDWKQKQEEAQQNNLFFYYKVGSLMKEGRFEYKR